MGDDFEAVGKGFMRVYPSGNHVQIGIDPIEIDGCFSLVMTVSYLDMIEVIPHQGGHGAIGQSGQFFEALPFLIGEANAQNMGTRFDLHEAIL